MCQREKATRLTRLLMNEAQKTINGDELVPHHGDNQLRVFDWFMLIGVRSTTDTAKQLTNVRHATDKCGVLLTRRHRLPLNWQMCVFQKWLKQRIKTHTDWLFFVRRWVDKNTQVFQPQLKPPSHLQPIYKCVPSTFSVGNSRGLVCFELQWFGQTCVFHQQSKEN